MYGNFTGESFICFTADFSVTTVADVFGKRLFRVYDRLWTIHFLCVDWKTMKPQKPD